MYVFCDVSIFKNKIT